MRMLRVWLVALLAVIAANAMARQGVSIVNHEGVAIVTASGRVPSDSEVAQAIRTAANSVHWEVSDSGPGRMVATLVVRGKHTASVDITYSGQTFTVKYRNSVNMNYVADGGTGLIHPHYNSWVQSLVNAIRARVSTL